MRTDSFYAIDRLESGLAVLVGDPGDRHEVALELLPPGSREGDVLRVPLGAGGEPDWAGARPDPEERERRRREAEGRLRELEQRDPGGDIEL